MLTQLSLAGNVRRYVQLAQSRGGACFCTRGAGQGCDVVLFIVALAKTVTPRGSPPAVPGAARGASHKLFLFSYIIVAPRKAMTYTDLLCGRALFPSLSYELN